MNKENYTFGNGRFVIISKRTGVFKNNSTIAALDRDNMYVVLGNGDITHDIGLFDQVIKPNNELKPDEIVMFYSRKIDEPVIGRVNQKIKDDYIVFSGDSVFRVPKTNLISLEYEVGQRVRSSKLSEFPGLTGTVVSIENKVDPEVKVNWDNCITYSVYASDLEQLPENEDTQLKELKSTINKILNNPTSDNYKKYKKIIDAVYAASHGYRKEENLKYAMCLIENELKGNS